jgi:orotidine-5'-phosphate decarboxylase
MEKPRTNRSDTPGTGAVVPRFPPRHWKGPAMTTFGARLHAAMQERGPLCAGIDPHAVLLHDWGLDDDVAGLERFALTAAEALAPRVSVVKPQSAFYERFGSRGIAVLERLVTTCRDAGALVLLDVKRGDIGSTSQAYADAYLDQGSPLAVDAITASPFLGFGSLAPMVDTARKHDAGLFVLALTSNKEGPEVQEARTGPDDRTVADVVLDHLRALNDGAEPLGSFGAVIGATIDGAGHRLDINGPVLAPGFGAQGGTVDDLRRIFGTSVGQVLPSTSRELLGQGPDHLGDAADRLNEQLRGLAG